MKVYLTPSVESRFSLTNPLRFLVVAQSGTTSNQCGDFVQAGGDTPETHSVQMGASSGTFAFSYDTLSIEDQIIVSDHNGTTLFDSGCVGTNGTLTEDIVILSSPTVTVQVNPNCATGGVGTGTQWNFTVACPT